MAAAFAARQLYSRWDGSQAGDFPDPDELFDKLAEDVFHGWDFESALRRLLDHGFRDSEGRRLRGLEGLLERLRQERQERLQRFNLEGLFRDIEERLDRILQRERQTLERRREETRGGPGEALAAKTAAERLAQLDQLPPEPGSAIGKLQDYEFMDPQAEQEFRELLGELRRDLAESHFQRLGQRLGRMGPQQMAQLQEMVSDLNQMLTRQLGGEPAGYQEFMDKWGAAFPDHPPDLEQFLDQLQRQMAERESLLQSLSPEARQRFQEMMDGALSDEGMRSQLERLSELLSQLSPGPGAGGFGFFGEEELSFPEAMDMMGQLQRLEEAESGLRAAYQGTPPSPELLAQLQELLGPAAAGSASRVGELLDQLRRRGQLQLGPGGPELTPTGIRRIGQKALGDVFRKLKADRLGGHRQDRPGVGVEGGEESKPYEFGDRFSLDVERTLMNAVRQGRGGPPTRLERSDFEVVRPERSSSSSTVLMLDISRSMPLRGYFYAAKKMALALDSLIRTQFPRDNLYVVGFSVYARLMSPLELAQLSYNEYAYGTNMEHGLSLARSLLRPHRGGSCQVILVSDGEPTVHMEGDGPVYCWPPLPETLRKTLQEVRRCSRERIVINTFMLDSNPRLVGFVKQLTRLNRGRAFFVSPDRLGDYVLLDYVDSRSQPA